MRHKYVTNPTTDEGTGRWWHALLPRPIPCLNSRKSATRPLMRVCYGGYIRSSSDGICECRQWRPSNTQIQTGKCSTRLVTWLVVDVTVGVTSLRDNGFQFTSATCIIFHESSHVSCVFMCHISSNSCCPDFCAFSDEVIWMTRNNICHSIELKHSTQFHLTVNTARMERSKCEPSIRSQYKGKWCSNFLQ